MAQAAKQQTFASVLDMPASAAERPPALPVGDYVAVIQGQPTQGSSAKKGTPFIEYTMKPLMAVEGTVDEDALKEYGPVDARTLRLTFYITENSAYRHREFLEDDLGLEIGNASHWEAAQMAPGSQCIIHVTQEPTQDNKGFWASITGTAPVS